jgi:hypothetical protein
MRTKLILVAAAILAVPAMAAPPASTIKVGQVLDDSLGKTVNGWLHTLGSMFSSYETKGDVTTGKLDCCIAMLTKGRSYIVARTEPLARNATNGVIKEKVIGVQRIDLRPGEVETLCSLFSLQIVFSVRNPKTNQVRSVVVDEGKLATLEWHDTNQRCGEEGP